MPAAPAEPIAPRCGHSAFLALGANLGDPLQNLRAGVKQLQTLAVAPLVLSAPWITAPVHCPPGSPPFANAALQITLPRDACPESFLCQCQTIERALGRRPATQPNQARPLDIDLIAFDHLATNSPRLILPHPRVSQRFFVLAPLNEIAPNLVLPGHRRSIAEHLASCPADSSARRLVDFQW